MTIRFLITLTLGLSTGAKAFAANGEFDFDCAAILEAKAPITAVNRAWAREILAWISLSHPIATRAIQRSNDKSFLYDMLFLGTGFALPPVREVGGSMRAFEASTEFQSRLFFENWGRKSFSDDAEAALELGASSRDARLVVTQRIAARARQLLVALGKAYSPSDVNSQETRWFRFYEEVLEKSWVHQKVRLRWDSSFLTEEFKRLAQLRDALEDDDVMAAVVRELHSNLPRIIRAQRALTDIVNVLTTTSDFKVAHRAWLGSQEYAAVHYFAEGLPPEATLGENIAPSVPKVVEKPPAPKPTEESSPVTPPPGRVATTSSAPFDVGRIDEFLAAVKLDLPERLAEAPLLKLWSQLNRAGLVFTASLGQLAKWRTEEPDWASWEKSFSASDAWRASLHDTLGDLHQRREVELDQLIVAEAAFARLHAWLVNLNDYFRRFDDLAKESEVLSDRDIRTLRAVLDQLQGLELVSDRTTYNIQGRQALIFDLNVMTNQLTYMLGDVEQQRLLSGATPDLENLRSTLGALAKPLHEEPDED